MIHINLPSWNKGGRGTRRAALWDEVASNRWHFVDNASIMFEKNCRGFHCNDLFFSLLVLNMNLNDKKLCCRSSVATTPEQPQIHCIGFAVSHSYSNCARTQQRAGVCHQTSREFLLIVLHCAAHQLKGTRKVNTSNFNLKSLGKKNFQWSSSMQLLSLGVKKFVVNKKHYISKNGSSQFTSAAC